MTRPGVEALADLDAIRARHGATRHATVYLGACDTCVVLAALDDYLANMQRLAEAADEYGRQYDAALAREARLRGADCEGER